MIIVDEIADSREISLSDVFVGQTFMIPSIKGYFMRIDKPKGIISPNIDGYFQTLGVNIATGEISIFDKRTKVIPVFVKCNVSMNND